MYSAELKKIVEVFELESVLPELSLEGRSVLRKEINRPALQLAGFYERFDSDRLQVIGRAEYNRLYGGVDFLAERGTGRPCDDARRIG